MFALDIKKIYQWPLVFRVISVLPLCIAILYVAYFLDFSSLNKQLATAKAQEKDLREQLALIFSQQAKVQKEVSQSVNSEKMLTQWQNKIVSVSKIPALLNDILKIGTVNGVKFESLTPEGEVKAGDYNKIPVKMVARGTYHQIASFISQVINIHPLIVVNDLMIETLQEPSTNKSLEEQVRGKSILNIVLILDIYVPLENTILNQPEKKE